MCNSQVQTLLLNILYIDIDILLTAIALNPGGGSKVHIYTQTIQNKHKEHTPSIIFITCVNCDVLTKQHNEVVTELKSLRSIK